jgi:hypothetical protein
MRAALVWLGVRKGGGGSYYFYFSVICCSLASNGIVQAVSYRLLTAEARVRAQSTQLGFVMDKVALGQVFLSESFGLPVSVSFHHCSIFTHYHLCNGQQAR